MPHSLSQTIVMVCSTVKFEWSVLSTDRTDYVFLSHLNWPI